MADAVILTKPINSGTGGGSGIVGLQTTIINGQPMLTLDDTTRGGKTLSVSEQIFLFGENKLSNLDWLRVAEANDADSGYVADFDGTVVNISAHCENTGSASKEIRLFIDDADTASLGVLSGGSNATINNTTLNVDFNQGQRIRLRAVDGVSGTIEDTIIKLTVKWRG